MIGVTDWLRQYIWPELLEGCNDEEWYEDFWDKLYDTLEEQYGWGIKLKLSEYCSDFHYVYPTKLTSGSLTTKLVYKNGKKLVEATIIVGPDVGVPLDEPNENATFESDSVEELAGKLNDFVLKIDRKIREKLAMNKNYKGEECDDCD